MDLKLLSSEKNYEYRKKQYDYVDKREKNYNSVDKKNNSSNIIFKSIIAITMILVVAFMILAVGCLLLRGMPNLIENLKKPEIRFSIRLSLITSCISTIICVLVAIPVSYGITRFNFTGKRIVELILDLPLALPPIVSGLALLILFGNSSFGRFMEKIGFPVVFTVRGIVLAQFFVNLPNMIKILKAAFYDIDPRIENVSRTLGLNSMQTFFKVTLPLARNNIIASLVITWATSLGQFGAVVMIAGATRMKTEVLPISVYLNMSCGEIDVALASASILIIISTACLFIFQLLQKNK
ncbi:ABC transporter permease [Haloimpatiens sp. FM7330]|uniref:ABC transporter permease n=1 Tax=Haloimpatiens sp. FM7330 TaxID=3298610 RepID=UPI0036300788